MICTAFAAYRLGFGGMTRSFLSSFSQPFAWFSWLRVHYTDYPETFNYILLILALGFLAALLGCILYAGFKTRSSRKYETSHGSARFAEREDIVKGGLLPWEGKKGKGVYCAAFENIKKGTLEYMRHDGLEHIAVIAPTRSGKGVGVVIPTLLSCPYSVFVLDPKGELYAITGGWRKEEANNLVLRFEPSAIEGSCSWNPLSEIRYKTRYQIGDTQNIALMLVDSDGKGVAGQHFRSAAFELLTGLILHLLYKDIDVGRLPGLADCAHTLKGVGVFAAKESQDNTDDAETTEEDHRALASLFAEMTNLKLDHNDLAAREACLVINGVGRRMANTPSRELGSIISTAANALVLYADPIVAGNTTRIDFKVEDLMDHDCPVSFYYITTNRDSERMKPLARLLLTQIVQKLADKMEYDDTGRSKTMHKHRLLLMLDEFPTLGRLPIVETAMSVVASYNMKFCIIIQDIEQLYQAYERYQSILSNCQIRVAFAPNNLATAELLSKMTGIATIEKDNIGTSGNRFGMMMEKVSHSYQEVQRALMTVDEVMQMVGPEKDMDGKIIGAGELLVFVSGMPVIKGKQILYYLDPTFSMRSKIRPPKKSDHIRLNLTKEEAPIPEQRAQFFVSGEPAPKSADTVLGGFIVDNVVDKNLIKKW